MKIISTLAFFAIASTAQAVELVVHKQHPHHVHAEFNGIGYENQHIGETSAHTRFYDVASDQTLFEVHSSEDHTTLAYPGQDAITIPKVESHQNWNDVMLQQGEEVEAALARGAENWKAHPHFALLENLSVQLSSAGIEGKDHPASFYLHRMVSDHLDAQEEARRDAIWPSTQLEAQTDDEFLEMGQELMAGRRRRRRRNMINIENYHGFWSQNNRLFSRVGRCIGEKRGNPCFGLCGPICKCWKGVCGDCDRVHRGCWEHDCICMKCTNNNPRNTRRCLKVKAHSDTCNFLKCADQFCGRRSVNDGDCTPQTKVLYNTSTEALADDAEIWNTGETVSGAFNEVTFPGCLHGNNEGSSSSPGCNIASGAFSG